MTAKITALELAVAIDTMVHSTQIADGVGLFSFTVESRKAVADHLNRILNAMTANIVIEDGEAG